MFNLHLAGWGKIGIAYTSIDQSCFRITFWSTLVIREFFHAGIAPAQRAWDSLNQLWLGGMEGALNS